MPSSGSDRGFDRDRGGFGGDSFRDRERGGGFGDRDRERGFGGFRDREPRRDFDDGPSRADTGDWGTKQFAPSSPRRARDSFREPSKADLEDRWERSGDGKPIGFDDRPRRPLEDDLRGPSRRGFADSWRGREREGSSVGSRDGSVDTWRKAAPEEDAGAANAPAERPKLNLKPRSATADGGAAEGAAVSRPSVFGAARPREEVLKELGRDPIAEEKRLEQRPERPDSAAGRGRKPTAEEEALKVKLEEAKAAVQDADDKEAAEAAVQALEEELVKLKVEQDSRPPRGRDSRGGGRGDDFERSGSRRRDGGASFARRDRGRDGSRDAAPRGGGDRW